MTIPEAPHLNALAPIQPCYSNPGLKRFLAGRIAAYVNRHPEIEVFSLWPHDGVNNWCQCPDCIRRSPFELMYHVACEATKRIPARIPIELIAYANTLTLPRAPLPRNDRIVSMLCPYLRPYLHRVYDRGGPPLVMGTLYPEADRVNPVDDRDYGILFRLWKRVWSRAGNTLGIFEYGGNLWFDESFRFVRQRFMHHPPNAIRFAEARWYARHGVPYVYMCSSFKGWPDASDMLGAARAVWACGESPEDFDRRFYAAVAGARGEAFRRRMGRVADDLTAFRNPGPALNALERLLDRLPPSAMMRRYRLWCRYVRLAWPGHRAERQGRAGTALECERRVARFLRGASSALAGVAAVPQLLAYSRCRRSRLRAIQAGTLCKDYRL